MIIDHQLQVSNEQTVTVTAPSTDVIDFGQVRPNSGMNDLLKCVITVDQTALAAGAATVTFAVQDSADNVTFADVNATAAIGKAALTLGKQFILSMPVFHRRYVRVNYTVATGPLTAGRFSAQVVTGIQANSPYPGVL
jgi:hypothetical protein